MAALRLFITMLTLAVFVPCANAAPKKSASKSSSSKTAASKKRASSGTSASKSTAKSTTTKSDEDEKEEAKKEPAPGELTLFARAALALDAETGAVLYEKNADAKEFPASSTKILTALIVLESGDLDKLVTIEEVDTKVEPSALEVKPGEQYPRRNLLYALMLKSANDVANALARDNAGSVAAFAEKMNQRAAAAGAQSSHFVNPHGLHDPEHYTTARDLAKITQAAMKNPLFREIVATKEIWLRKADEWMYFRNKNRLLTRLPECTGVKTGYTRPAQQVLVSAAAKEGKETISVVLHTNKPGIWDDSTLLLKHGLAKLLAPPEAPANTPPAADAPESEAAQPTPGTSAKAPGSSPVVQ